MATQSTNTVPNGSVPSPPSQSSDGRGQAQLNAAYFKEYVLKLSTCNTIGELLKAIPVPVQPVSRDILDGVYQASQKLGGAQTLLAFWEERLRSKRFAEVSQLNSLRSPIVQVCKEAIGPDDGGLRSMTLDATLYAAKESALTRMIEIKRVEVANLSNFVQSNCIVTRLAPAWESVLAQQASMITPEHATIIQNPEVVHKVAQITASIGESSSQRARIAKDKRTLSKKEADIDMTDVSSVQSKKQLMTLVEEALKRKEQSRRDRTQSGKGKGSSGTPKKKTQKTKERTKKKGASKVTKPKARPGKPPKRR